MGYLWMGILAIAKEAAENRAPLQKGIVDLGTGQELLRKHSADLQESEMCGAVAEQLQAQPCLYPYIHCSHFDYSLLQAQQKVSS